MTTAHSPGIRGHIPALDGLRGCAILLVISWHYLPHGWIPGWAGVDLFFVLSGYLITGRLIQTKDRPDYFLNFHRNRILRIFPLYYAVVISYLIIVSLFVSKQHLPFLDIYITHWKSFLLFTSNWTFIFYGVPKDLSLVPLWSIAVEEQFYLIWPLLILLIPTRSRLRLLSVLFVLIPLIRSALWLFYPSFRDTAYYNTFFRMDSFIAGSLLCHLHFSGTSPSRINARILTAICVVLLISGVGWMKDVDPENMFFSTVGFSVIALFAACLIHLAASPGDHLLTRFLEFRFLRSAGRISYCLYLVHMPVLLNIGQRLYRSGVSRWPSHSFCLRWMAVGSSLVISTLISLFSYRYFESYFLRLKKPLTP